MAPALEQSPAGGLGRLVLVAAAFGVFFPVPLFAFPLALLLLSSRPQTGRERLVAFIAAGLSLAWLLVPGDLPDQVLRASLVFCSVTFVILTRTRNWSFTHRALLSLGAATAGVIVLFLVFGWTWDQLHWWVITQRGYESSQALARLRLAPENGALADNLQQLLEQSVTFEANNYAALCALRLLPGLAIATALYHRLAREPRGAPLGRFRDFRFSEHLGWAAVIPLLIVLLPGLLRAKVAATNVLLLTGTLYALRGLAVAAFAVGTVGTGPLTALLAVMATLLMLPVVLGMGILVGVLDAGMDLRRRWSKPPARN